MLAELFTPSLSDIKEKLREKDTFFPVALPIEMDQAHWFELYKRVSHGLPYHALLESGRAGRYSFMLCHPVYSLQAKDGEITVRRLTDHGEVEQTERIKGRRALSFIDEWLAARQAPCFEHLPDFQGGLVGFFSYDLVREIEKLPAQSKDDLATPELYLVGFEQVLAYDHVTEQHWLIRYQQVEGKQLERCYEQAKQKLAHWAREIESLLQEIELEAEQSLTQSLTPNDPVNFHRNSVVADLETSFSKAGFVEAVQHVQEYITKGDVFQVNLSVRQSTQLEAPPLEVYAHLREINPSPYMGFLHFPELEVISASPEQLVKVRGQQVATRPIGGTRPRGTTLQEHERLIEELRTNVKENAEHIMLVDVERGDLGKVCRYGSVRVNEWRVIEEYSHVIHLVSSIEGELKEETSLADVIAAMFPGGTITGAPKVRTLEIIEELEPVRRGVYTGSIGWLDYCGDMELNIVIRTMIVQNGQAYVQAGAGIVSDSIPEKEYEECLKKAEALWRAYERSILQSSGKLI